MKKFYAFAAAAVATLGMNAQLYVCGNGTGLGWEPANPLEVAEENGAYTFEVENLVEFKVSTTKGTWDEYNAGAYTCEYTAENMGQPVELVPGDGNISAPWKGDYKVVVKLGDAPTITLTTSTPAPTGPVNLYIRGEVNGWGAEDAWLFENTGAGMFQFVAKGETMIPANGEFKIADADWGSYNYGAGGAITVNTKEEEEDGDEVGKDWNYNDTNGFVAEDFEGTIEVKLLNPAAPKEGAHVTLFKGYFAGVEAAIVESNEAKTYYNLQGVQVENPTKGLYIVRQGGKAFKAVVK